MEQKRNDEVPVRVVCRGRSYTAEYYNHQGKWKEWPSSGLFSLEGAKAFALRTPLPGTVAWESHPGPICPYRDAQRRFMLNDSRPIKTLYFPGEKGGCVIVGHFGITKIDVYGEPGQEALVVPWFRVWEGSTVSRRYNGAYVDSVVYAKPEDNEVFENGQPSETPAKGQ